MIQKDTICSISSPNGSGAIAIIRMSGEKSFDIAFKIASSRNFKSKIGKISEPRSLHLVNILKDGTIIDQSMLAFMNKTHSYTGEDSVEIYCHGSYYIQKSILELLIDMGARLAKPGEYTLRAFYNGKMDLLQAEGVADLIASNTKAAHHVAMNQMRGGFSNDLKNLRQQLIDFAALIELELDFGEEDVEFADRKKMLELLQNIKTVVSTLKDSFSLGNVIKNGIPVAIVGKPNVGKSTLLNLLLNEERAIVSEIPGTTRDALEDLVIMNGFSFRFIDTAGLRDTEDTIESMGIDITYKKIEQSEIVLYIVDITETSFEEIQQELADFKTHISNPNKKFIIVANKIDMLNETPSHFRDFVDIETVFISAKRKENISQLKEILISSANIAEIGENTVLTNVRHYEALQNTYHSINDIIAAFENKTPSDLIAIDIKQAINHIGSITGEIVTEDILSSIFGKFCIGK